MTCQIDTCGENREDGVAWPVEFVVYRYDAPDTPIFVCGCHADGWYDDLSRSPRIPERVTD